MTSQIVRVAGFLTAALLAASSPQADPHYFTTTRDVHISDVTRQNYVVLDPAVWKHARPDLGDIRFYAGDVQVAYVLQEARGGSSSEEHTVKILNLGTVGDHTEFDLDMEGIAEYDHIRLQLDGKDFVASATAEGSDKLSGGVRTPWPMPSTLYDFSTENLGSNSSLSLPTWTFRYVRVRLSHSITPRQVKGAYATNLQRERAAYIPVGSCRAGVPRPRHTVLECGLSEHVPLDRIAFDIPPHSVNFRRNVSIQDDKGQQIGGGEISRIHTRREGREIDSEELAVQACFSCGEHFNIVIDNGDDAPLIIDSVVPQAFQRRLYFEPAGRTALKLYYGDSKLSAPVYDYAKFFKGVPNPAQAYIGPALANPSYRARPDDRPWSERHKWLLWAAMLVAVVVLAWLAVRGFRDRVVSS